MKADVMRRSSQVTASQAKIAHDGEARESRAGDGGERRESKPGDGGERRESKPDHPARDRRDSRWDDHRRARRQELVDATIAAVGKHGPGVGMEEIAAEAGTSKTVVYRHFADRAELHVAVCNRVASQLLPRLRSAIESSSHPRGMVAAAIDTYLAFLEVDPQLYRFVVHPQGHNGHLGPGDPITSLSEVVGEQAAAAIAVALQQSGGDPAAAAPWGHGVVGLVRSAADWWLQAERPMLRSELAAHLTDLAWAGLSGVVTTAPPRKEDT
jgi:AcrR family transcriptional regulator